MLTREPEPMSTAYLHKPYVRFDGAEYDSGKTVTIRVSCNARDRKEYLRNKKILPSGFGL
jgi:hypothetical protein